MKNISFLTLTLSFLISMTIGCEEKDLYNTRSEGDREMVVLKNEIDKIATQYSCDNATE